MVTALSNMDKERNLQKVGDFILDAVDALSLMEAGSQAYTQQQMTYFLSLRAARVVRQPRTEPYNEDIVSSQDQVSAEGFPHTGDDSRLHHFSEMMSELRARAVWDAAQPQGSLRIQTPDVVPVNEVDAYPRERPAGNDVGLRGARRKQDVPSKRDGTLTVEVPRMVHIDLPDLHVELGLHTSTISAHIYSSHNDNANDEKTLLAVIGSADKT